MIGGLFPVRAGVTSVGSVVLLLVAVRSSLVELGVRLGLVAGCLGRDGEGWGVGGGFGGDGLMSRGGVRGGFGC